MSPEALQAVGEAFARSERTIRATPDSWCEQVAEVLGLPPPGAAILHAYPVLELHPGGPASAGLSYEPGTGVLFVPGPLAPPAGDELKLLLRDGRCSAASIVTVQSVRRPSAARRATPAGFSLLIRPEDSGVRQLLVDCLSQPAPGLDTRAAPRFRVRGTVTVVPVADDDEVLEYGNREEFQSDYIENLSHGGAFIRTAKPRRRGDQVTVHLRVPGAPELKIPGMVVHVGERGVGIQFAKEAEALEQLAAVVAELPGRAPRVLVVDDDALARAMLVDALSARGFEAKTVRDGEAGLRAITDELFSLDVVVTDVNMPGMTGDALVSTVRQLGGETDLALVVISATIDEDHARSLLGVGADAVVAKGSGVDAIVDAVEAAVARRKDPAPARRTGPDDVVSDPFEVAPGSGKTLGLAG